MCFIFTALTHSFSNFCVFSKGNYNLFKKKKKKILFHGNWITLCKASKAWCLWCLPTQIWSQTIGWKFQRSLWAIRPTVCVASCSCQKHRSECVFNMSISISKTVQRKKRTQSKNNVALNLHMIGVASVSL